MGRADTTTEQHLKVPTMDFDFESSNAQFDKATAVPPTFAASKTTSESGADEVAGAAESGPQSFVEKEKEPPVYNPQKSFFDLLSSSAAMPSLGAGGSGSGAGGPLGHGANGSHGGGKQGGSGHNRCEEERETHLRGRRFGDM